MFEKLNQAKRRWMTELTIKYIANRNDPGILNLQSCWQNVRHCLVCLPETGIDVLFAEMIFYRLNERFANSNITTLVLPGISASPPDIGVKIVKIKQDHFSLFGLPTRRLRQMIQKLRVDVAVDLSPEYNPLTAYCCCISGARLRVGFSCKKGKNVFNYQIVPKSKKVGIDRYRTLARYIG